MAKTIDRILSAIQWRANQAVERFVTPAENAARQSLRPERDSEIARIDREWSYSPTALAFGAQPIKDAESRKSSASAPRGEFGDIPISIWLDWNLKLVKSALGGHAVGIFGQAAMLTEAMLSDDRIQSAANGRAKGVTKCELKLVPSDNAQGEEAAKELEECWDEIMPEDVQEQILQWATFEGFALAEVIWEPWPIKDKWLPRLKVWHPFYVWYNIGSRRYNAITLEGNLEIDPDDPKWFLYTPFGEYRGWIRGAVRSCAVPWLVRQFALRDWARFSEVHGLPIKLGKYPAQAPAEDKARFIAGLKNLGAETTIGLPIQAGPDAAAWGFELLEATDKSWEAFPGLRDACDQTITLAIRGTNLTTQVGGSAKGGASGGSRAASETHRDEDSDYALADRKKLASKLKRHLFKWFCVFNYGASEAAPKEVHFIDPDGKDIEGKARAAGAVGAAIKSIRDAGEEVDGRAMLEDADIPLPPISDTKEEDTGGAIVLAPTDMAIVVRVDEARAALKLKPWGDENGQLSIAAFLSASQPKPVQPAQANQQNTDDSDTAPVPPPEQPKPDSPPEKT